MRNTLVGRIADIDQGMLQLVVIIILFSTRSTVLTEIRSPAFLSYVHPQLCCLTDLRKRYRHIWSRYQCEFIHLLVSCAHRCPASLHLVQRGEGYLSLPTYFTGLISYQMSVVVVPKFNFVEMLNSIVRHRITHLM